MANPVKRTPEELDRLRKFVEARAAAKAAAGGEPEPATYESWMAAAAEVDAKHASAVT